MLITTEKLQNMLAETQAHIAERPHAAPEAISIEVNAQLFAQMLRLLVAGTEQKPVGSFHIADQEVEATTDYLRKGEWPIDNGELLVYAAPRLLRELPGGFSQEEARALHANLVQSHVSKALSGEKMNAAEKNADLSWIKDVIVSAAWFVQSCIETSRASNAPPQN